MADKPGKSSKPQVTQQALTDEVKRLRAEVHDLKTELLRYQSPEKRSDVTARSGRQRRDSVYSYHSGGRQDRNTNDLIDESSNLARELPGRFVDEVSKVVRGITFAHLEHLRVAADAAASLADEVFQRNRSEPVEPPEQSRKSSGRYEGDRVEERGRRRSRPTTTSLVSDLPRDIYSGFVRTADRMLDAPGQAVDRFYKSYRETDAEAEPVVGGGSERDRETNGDPLRRSTKSKDRDRDVVTESSESVTTGVERSEEQSPVSAE